MNTLIIGGSGFIGSALVKEALSRDFSVTTLVRNPDKIQIKNQHLTVKKCDIANLESLKQMCQGFETVISAYNPGWTNPNIYEDTLNNYPTIINAVKAAGVKRVLIVGGAGSLKTNDGKLVMDSGTLPEDILPAVKSLGKFYFDILKKENDIDWVFFSPAGNIAHGKRTGVYKLGKDDLIVDKDGKSNISVEDYSKAMIDELEKPQHHKERFTIGY